GGDRPNTLETAQQVVLRTPRCRLPEPCSDVDIEPVDLMVEPVDVFLDLLAHRPLSVLEALALLRAHCDELLAPKQHALERLGVLVGQLRNLRLHRLAKGR